MRSFLALAAVALVLAGCTGGSGTSTATPDAPKEAPKAAEGTLKVALLTPGNVNDSGWNALAYEGLQKVKADVGAEIQNSEAKDAGIKDAMRSYAQKGFNVVFGHGFEYNEPAILVAKDFPNTVFISSSGAQTAPNVGAFRFYLEQGFYLAGYMSGMMTKSGTVAMIGGPEFPSIKSTFKAFKAGAEAAKPGIKVIETFTGDGSDSVKAKQATEKAIEQGADFVIHQANAAAQGVFEACKEKNVMAFGANLDQNNNPSGVVVASATIVAGNAFVDIAKAVKEGTFKGGIALKGMDIGAIDFVFNPAMDAKIPADVKTKIEALKADIKSGKLVIPKDEF